jgi:hypothetical protein
LLKLRVDLPDLDIRDRFARIEGDNLVESGERLFVLPLLLQRGAEDVVRVRAIWRDFDRLARLADRLRRIVEELIGDRQVDPRRRETGVGC